MTAIQGYPSRRGQWIESQADSGVLPGRGIYWLPDPARGAGYPFRLVVDSNNLPRHKMNLLFALVAQADDLTARGFVAEARRLLQEAVLLEPGADFVSDRIKALP